jgi:hypothetical protein
LRFDELFVNRPQKVILILVESHSSLELLIQFDVVRTHKDWSYLDPWVYLHKDVLLGVSVMRGKLTVIGVSVILVKFLNFLRDKLILEGISSPTSCGHRTCAHIFWSGRIMGANDFGPLSDEL